MTSQGSGRLSTTPEMTQVGNGRSGRSQDIHYQNASHVPDDAQGPVLSPGLLSPPAADAQAQGPSWPRPHRGPAGPAPSPGACALPERGAPSRVTESLTPTAPTFLTARGQLCCAERVTGRGALAGKESSAAHLGALVRPPPTELLPPLVRDSELH